MRKYKLGDLHDKVKTVLQSHLQHLRRFSWRVPLRSTLCCYSARRDSCVMTSIDVEQLAHNINDLNVA